MLLNSKKVDISVHAKDFELKNVDNEFYTLNDIKKRNGFVIAFICNHCPYVKDIITRLVDDFNILLKQDVGVAAVMPNDYKAYPEDSFENMQKFSNNNNFSFPYLFDDKQEVAKSYGAVCTPDFFCFDNRNKLFYRGRLDNVKFKTNFLEREKSIINAYEKMIKQNSIVTKQFSSMGCSIKWR